MKPNTVPFTILFKLATKGRPSDFIEAMESLYSNAADHNNMHVLITAGEDDLTMNNPEMIERVKKYQNAHLIFGENSSKSQATNRDLDLKNQPWSNWDILVNYADDQRFITYDFDNHIRTTMNTCFPEFDGLLHYFEPDTGSALAVQYCAGRAFFDKFGFIAHPQYKSLFWDNYYMEAAKIMCKYHYVGTHIFNHLCPAYGHHNKPRDAMFDRDQGYWTHDENIYHKHMARNFDLVTDESGQIKFNLILDPTPGNDD